MLATPLLVIDNKAVSDDVGAVVELARRHMVTRIIVGLPRAADGTIRRQAEKVQEFVQRLTIETSVPIEFRDEGLSTVLGAERMREAGGRRRKRKVRDDAAAAAVVLQGYLDELRLPSDAGEETGWVRPGKVGRRDTALGPGDVNDGPFQT